MFKKFFQSTPAQQVDPLRYERLQPGSIRLLRILARGTSPNVITCRLAHFELVSCPPYTTLSYTWGSDRRTANIIVNGRAFGVRKNLLAFLEQAVSSNEDPDRLFWIDQICINQQDTEERNEQVMQIGRVYKEAANMVIWLGQASFWKDSDMAMSLIQDVAQWVRDQDRGEGDRGEGDRGEGDRGEEAAGDKDSGKQKTEKNRILLTKDQANAVIELLERPYWSRLWIVQEISLSKKADVWCGSARVDIEAIATFIKARPFYLPSSKNPDAAAGVLIHVKEATQIMFYNRPDGNRPGTYSVMAAVAFFADNQCHDPRDKIYGLLGIIGGEHKITVDYSKSSLEVFVDVMNWWLIDNRDDEGSINDILDFGQSMGVLRRGTQRERVTRWVEEHPGLPLSAREMEGLV
jgi:hypothetical protein